MVHEEVVEYLKKEKTVSREDDLTEEEISEIKIGLEQIKNGETVDWNDYLKATSRWHTK
jgi:predicted transcriptional regulator